MQVAFSVDLEPNKDGSFEGVAEAMDWYDRAIPRGTAYTTYRIATERPEIVSSLAADHEIGVHVHPKEFGHEDDDLAALPVDRQRELIERTRGAVADAIDADPADLDAFRAGRHKASLDTLRVLADLGFSLDASINVNYRDHMPASMADRTTPFRHDSGLVELPTTYGRPSPLSRVGLRTFPNGTITATAHTLRTDRRLCSGLRALRWLVESGPDVVSMYMHPYDATAYHEDLENNGQTFRDRVERLFAETDPTFQTASQIAEETDD